MDIQTSRDAFGNWLVIDADTYDGPGSILGYGPTELLAIADFEDRIRGGQDIESETWWPITWFALAIVFVIAALCYDTQPTLLPIYLGWHREIWL